MRRAWGWVAHLTEGGTTPWADWAGEGPSRGRHVPGAQQLETLRRLNATGPVPESLAGRVLAASAPGRGRPDLELAGAVAAPPFGPLPVDPAELPEEEMLRVATSVLADLVVEAAEGAAPEAADGTSPEAPGPPRPGAPVVAALRRLSPRSRSRRYRLVGDPLLADPVRAVLVARGRPPGGRGSRVLVLGDDAASLLADAWTHRTLTDGAPPWPEWVAARARVRSLPPRVDLLRAARAWRARVGVERVHVVLDPERLPTLLGARPPLPPPRRLSADAAELARRVRPVLGLLATPERRTVLVRDVLVPWLVAAETPGRGVPLVVPPEHAPWLRGTAERVRDELLRDGYAVHGDPDRLLPVERAGTSRPSDAGALQLALRLLLEKTTP